MTTTEYTATRPRDGKDFTVFESGLAEMLSRQGWRVTAVTVQMPHTTALGRQECEADGCELGASIELDSGHYCGAHAKARLDSD